MPKKKVGGSSGSVNPREARAKAVEGPMSEVGIDDPDSIPEQSGHDDLAEALTIAERRAKATGKPFSVILAPMEKARIVVEEGDSPFIRTNRGERLVATFHFS